MVDGESVTKSLHELAYEAFVGPYPRRGSALNDLTEEAQRAEQWRPVVGWEAKYLVSDMGRIWSLGRQRLLTPVLTSHGYVVVCLSLPPTRTTRKLHRIVLEGFRGLAPDGTETRHLDGDALNNQLANLAWGTKLQNADDMRCHGTHAIGSRNTCRRGHLYVEASLHLQTNGARTCRACKWATDVTRAHPDTYDTQVLADLLYAHLVGVGPDPRHNPDLLRSARHAVGSPC